MSRTKPQPAAAASVAAADTTRLSIHALLTADYNAVERTRSRSDTSSAAIASSAIVTTSRARKRVRRVPINTASGSSSDPDASIGSSEDGTDECAVAVLNGDSDDIFQPQSDESALRLPKAHEVRRLRAEAAALEAQLEALRHKWRIEIADPALLPVACAAAKQRYITAKYEDEQQQLKEQILLQQLFLATIQYTMTKSPLMRPLNSLDVFQAIHDSIHLGAANRKHEMERLRLRSHLALRLAPSLVERFTGDLVHRTSPLMPCTTTSVSADHEFTYVATATVSKIERASVQRVFDGVLHYFNSLDRELGHHYDVSHSISVIQQLGPMNNYAQLRYRSGGSQFASVSNTVFAASLTDDAGTIVIDFVDNDEQFPELMRENSSSSSTRQRRDACVVLSITLVVDPATHRQCVVVRHLRVHRFNLRPNSATMASELRVMQAYSNGDLFMSVLCRHLQQHEAAAVRKASLLALRSHAAESSSR